MIAPHPRRALPLTRVAAVYQLPCGVLPCRVFVSRLWLPVAVLAGWVCWPAIPAAAQPPASVQLGKVTMGKTGPEFSAVGTVKPVRRSTVGCAVSGRVIEMLVDVGDYVQEGSPVAKLRTETLEITLAGAEAERKLRQHELAELENWNTTRPQEIALAEARMRSAQAKSQYLQAKLSRTKNLHDKKAISDDEYQEVVSQSEQGAEDLLAAKASLDLAALGPRPEKLDQLRAKLASQDEVIRGLKDQLSKHTIFAPFSGEVVSKATEVGQWIATGDPVVEMVDLTALDVWAGVQDSALQHLQLGDPVTVDVSALPEQPLTGHVLAIVAEGDERSRRFPVKVRLEETNIGVLPGMLAKVNFQSKQTVSQILVPKDAVVLNGEAGVVWKFEPDANAKPEAPTGKVSMVPVVVTAASGGNFAVAGELQVGDVIVIKGNERLRPGQSVNVLPAGPPPRPGAASRERGPPEETARSDGPPRTAAQDGTARTSGARP